MMPTRLLRLTCCVVATVLVGVASQAMAATANDEFGLELVPQSRRVEDHRYISSRDYEATLKWFRDRFRGWKSIRTSREVSLPTVKYVHIENTNETSGWQGINIYQLRTGQVRYTVLPRLTSTATPPAKP